jgi:hypothetical protein
VNILKPYLSFNVWLLCSLFIAGLCASSTQLSITLWNRASFLIVHQEQLVCVVLQLTLYRVPTKDKAQAVPSCQKNAKYATL